MQAPQIFLLKCLAAGLLAMAASPAPAEFYSYQGQIQLQAISGDTCSEPGGAPLNIYIYGRDDAPGHRIDGYLYGEKIVGGHFSGNNLGQLPLTYPGESAPGHSLRLRAAGDGAFVGELEVRSLLSALSGCKFLNAAIKFTKIGTHTQDAYDQAATLFQMDSHAVQSYLLGVRGKVKESLPVLQAGLSEKAKVYGAAHPQLLPYYFLLAQLHDAAGSYLEEAPLYRKALEVCEQSYGPQTRCAALMLTSLAGVLFKTGNYVEAETLVRRAIAVCNIACAPESALTEANLNTLGAVLIHTGHYAEAQVTLNKALALGRKAFGREDVNAGVSLNDLGVLYRFTGQYGKAEAAMREALAIDEKALGADNPLVIINSIALAQILRISGRNAEAEPIARRALATAERVLGPERPDHPALSIGLIGLAEVLREKGSYAEAEPLYRRALANDAKYLGSDHPEIAVSSMLLAKALMAGGRDAEALALLKHAYNIAHVWDNRPITWRITSELMQFYRAGKSPQTDVAIFYGKESVNNLQQLRSDMSAAGNAAQESFVSAAEVASVYRTLADLLIREGRLGEAQQILAMLKEQEFYDFTERNADSDPRKTIASMSPSEKELDSLSNKDVTLGREYAALQEKFKKNHQLSSAEHDRLNALRKSMDAAQATFDSRAAAVAKSSTDPEARKRRGQEITDWSRSFQGTLKGLGHDAVLAQYFILDDKVAILLTTPNVVVAREADIKREDLNEQIRAYRKTLSSAAADPLPQAKALYQVLIGPIADDLRQAGAKTLMLSLDDTLRYLPFAALHDGKAYLIESLSIVMVTEAVRDKLGKPAAVAWSIWGLGVTRAHDGAQALPWVGVELNGITGPKGILAGKVLLDSSFTEGSLRDGLDQAYPIIHIASHFQFTPGSMDDSFLLLGDGSRMTLAQIKTRLNFNSVDLLTLSACETALGDDSVAHHGVEVEGLGAIAQQGGAKAVLATLWPVADSSTALLMRALYKAHKDDHLTKADALQKAQLTLLRGLSDPEPGTKGERGLTRANAVQPAGNFKVDPAAPFAHPYYWAPFILMGNWL
ncbi:MAG: CHAT domain-containing protein [Gammaproteobacteria bacterium]